MGEQPLNAMNPPHIVMIPLMAQGHMIPMVDIAALLAGRGVTVTFVVTPLNAVRIQPTIDRSREFGLPIEFLVLPFPYAAVGLPEGYENADTLPSRDLAPQFFAAAALLRPPLTLHLRSHAPSCVISDMCHPWTHELAREFQVPRLVFHGFGLFALLCFYNIRHNDDAIKSRLEEEDVNRPFVVPGLPDRIELTRAQVPGFIATPNLQMLREEMFRTEEAADGVVVNSSDDLEPPYKEW